MSFLRPVLSHYDSVVIRDKTGQRKPVFWHILRSVMVMCTFYPAKFDSNKLYLGINIPKLSLSTFVNYKSMVIQKTIKKRLRIIFKPIYS